MYTDFRDFEVWERRDVATEWGPVSAWPRGMLHIIEEGFSQFGGTFSRDGAEHVETLSVWGRRSI